MEKKDQVKIFELSFNIMEQILMIKDFTSKEEIMAVAQKAMEIVEKNESADDIIKKSYEEAVKKLESLSFEEMKEIKDIISD